MDPITTKRISDQLDSLTTALHRVADGMEAVLHILLDQARVTVSLTGEPAPPPLPVPTAPFNPHPKTDTRCTSCLQLWNKEHRANCAIAPGRTVEFRDCKEVPRVTD